MKNFIFAVMLVCGLSLVSCGKSTNSKSTSTDTTSVDSVAVDSVVVDSVIASK